MIKAKLSLPSLVFLTLLTACGSGADAPPASGPPGGGMPPTEVEVITVTPGSATLTQDLPGRLQAWRTAQVRARVEGIVEKRLFTEGTEVAQGVPLFQIEARTYQTALEAARADVEAARLVVQRYLPLLKLKAVSQQELDAAQARLKQSQAALARAALDLENTTVPAPIAGRIGRTLVSEGALVGRGEATPLATIEQIDPIYANFTLPGVDMLQLAAAVKAGTLQRAESVTVELLLEDNTRYPLLGQILFEDQAVDPSTGAVSLRALFPNPERAVLPGMFVRVRFPSARAEQVIRVPQRAVQGGPQGQFVTIVGSDGKVASQPIKTSGMVEGDFWVSQGLQGGEQVIINGLQKARPGMPVKALPWNPQGTPVIAPPPGAPPAAAVPAKKEG